MIHFPSVIPNECCLFYRLAPISTILHLLGGSAITFWTILTSELSFPSVSFSKDFFLVKKEKRERETRKAGVGVCSHCSKI